MRKHFDSKNKFLKKVIKRSIYYLKIFSEQMILFLFNDYVNTGTYMLAFGS